MPTMPHLRDASRLDRIVRRVLPVCESLSLVPRVLAPAIDLLVRLWIASVYWASGLMQMLDWSGAVATAAHRHLPFGLAPAITSSAGIAATLIGPLLLTVGLGSRLAAAGLLALTAAAGAAPFTAGQPAYLALLLGWVIVAGAGPLSLDHHLAAGLDKSAVPLAGALRRILRVIGRYAEPGYRLALRVLLAVLFFRSGSAMATDFAMTLRHFRSDYAMPLLPPIFAAWLATALELTMPAFLLLGFGTRLAALPLIAMTLVIDLAFAHHLDHAYWLLALALVALHGPGPLSLDHLVRRWAARRAAPPALTGDTPHVVIVGAGFGGLAAARGLRHAQCRVTLVDRRNYHLFQPLLYQVATASLSPADIATPIRGMFRGQPNLRVLLGEVTGVDARGQSVLVGERRLSYDYLVLATGARHGYFGHDDWAAAAAGLKQIEDATAIRRNLLLAFERAESADGPRERERLLTFVVIGGGPTGVELAGAIAELARHGMAHEFRSINPADARVLLIEGGPRLLAAFPESLSARAAQALAALGVEVRTGAVVDAIRPGAITAAGERIATETVFWAAGVAASPAARWLDAPADRAGRIKVGPDMSVPGLPNVFAIGDTAAADAWDGKPVPGLAPAAKQAGTYVASLIAARLEGRALPPPFRYRHLGSLATIGRRAAVADFGWVRLSGVLAWWLWGAVHVLFLVGARNRASVALQWLWAYLTYNRSTRLITGNAPEVEGRSAPVLRSLAS